MIAVRRLETLGFSIRCEGEEIVCHGSGGRDFNRPEVRELLAELKSNKAEALRYLRSRARRRAIRAFSRVLNEEVIISWDDGNPKVLHIDRTSYTLKEIENLKAFRPTGEELTAIHELKRCFDGELLNDDPRIHGK